MTQWVYTFGGGKAEGNATMKALLGGKGANLAEMATLGLPVPAGFTITTEVCSHFYDAGRAYPEALLGQVKAAMGAVEGIMAAGFGDPDNPLLLSVRSGAQASMPGMMDTVLNLGLNDTTVLGLIARSGDARFAYDSYRRFIQMYSNVVLGIDHHHFEELLEDLKADKGYEADTELAAHDWQELCGQYKLKVLERGNGEPFPDEPEAQLWGAVSAVFDSWQNARAVTYRRLNGIPDAWGTAVTVQAMVFGNRGNDCGTGVCFTRDPSTGENILYGEYLINAQGEDVVAGIRTPQSLTLIGKARSQSSLPAMEAAMPAMFADLQAIRHRLEAHYRDVQDMEFTIQSGKLWMLQTRSGKRTAQAALRIAVEMAEDGIITRAEAVKRIDPAGLDPMLHPVLDPHAPREVIATGLPASPGAASGRIVFTAAAAEDWVQRGEKVILVRSETSPDDIAGMHVAEGILTARGGMTSHAAVVARGMGRPCVAGAGTIRINAHDKTLTVGRELVMIEGDTLTLDGTSGQVIKGLVATLQPVLTDAFKTLLQWADDISRLTVRANAETGVDAETARRFGAVGIGLCRTEHMFFDPTRIIHMRKMILAEDGSDRRRALETLLPYQRQDFAQLFTIMAGLPVTVRLLDPPLHEFLPHTDKEMADVAQACGLTVARIKAVAAGLAESNPMLGHRGCRLGVTFPEIYAMQARAIFEAALQVTAATGQAVVPEIMIPLVLGKRELDLMKKVVEDTAEAVFAEAEARLDYLVGTMIELPRAALKAGEIAESAAFFSFGTNDLTQTTLGISRDDSERFLEAYRQQGVLAADPFATLDIEGVGELVKIAVQRGLAAKPGLKLGLCGEHGGDPASIHFCHHVGLDYVSCSPYRVPIARLAAAQAAMTQGATV